MKDRTLWFIVFAVVVFFGCQEDVGLNPVGGDSRAGNDLVAEQIAADLVRSADWEPGEDISLPPLDGKRNPAILDFQREIIAGDIAHYSLQLRVGPGQYDVIGIHRVVRERRPGQPIRTHRNLFLQHGSSKDFVGMWLPGLTSPTTPDDFGMAVYLARHDVDVWGIDQSWTLVPASETNTDFMIDWGLERQVPDLRLAVAVARATRILTGSGATKMILAGYSNGIPSSISVVNEETQLPPGLRNVGGYIPFDCPIKAEPGSLVQTTLAFYSEYYQSLHDAGLYAEVVLFHPMAELARCCPDDPSPYDPSLTNLQYVLVMSAGAVLLPGHPFHYWAGYLDPEGMPTGLRYTTWDLWLDFLDTGTAYEPIIWSVDWTGYVSGAIDTPYDDHLAEVRVPILNVTPAGGFAETTLYGLSLLGSTDVQTIIPAMGVPVLEEYAHIDLFTYEGSEQLVWQPVLEWIVDHTPGN